MSDSPITQDDVTQIISKVLGVEQSVLRADSSANDLEQWDSIRHLHLIFALEERFDVEFDEQEIGELTSLRMILDSLNGKAQNGGWKAGSESAKTRTSHCFSSDSRRSTLQILSCKTVGISIGITEITHSIRPAITPFCVPGGTLR